MSWTRVRREQLQQAGVILMRQRTRAAPHPPTPVLVRCLGRLVLKAAIFFTSIANFVIGIKAARQTLAYASRCWDGPARSGALDADPNHRWLKRIYARLRFFRSVENTLTVRR
jgi:hypothetical protein